DQVQGFAVTLFLGIVISLFTVLVLGKMLFEISERKRIVTTLKMMNIMPRTNFDFISKEVIAWSASALLIVAGLVAFFMRGNDNYDVDLSGGTMVTFQFEKPQNIEKVRDE